MSHNHSCSCDHANVKFCKICQVVHCLDCNQEWSKNYKFTYSTYPLTPYSYTYGLSTGSASGYTAVAAQQAAVGDHTHPQATTVTIAPCEHKA